MKNLIRSLSSASVKLAFLGLMIVPFIKTPKLPAGFSSDVARTHISIDGIDYGYFDQVNGLEDLAAHVTEGNLAYTRLTLKRDFVTDPSLYIWAKKNIEQRRGLKDIHLVMENDEGKTLASYTLKLCQPLSWSVEAVSPALGGFHETVDLAVQEISLQ